MKILQIVITKKPDGQYQVLTMGLNKTSGMGETLGEFEGTIGEVVATTAACIRLLEAPK